MLFETDTTRAQDLKNIDALDNPQPGDYWQEMFCPYFIVVDADKEEDSYTVLSCMGGPDSYNRKDEPCAKIEHKDGWSFDYSKSMKVNHAWIEKAVKYGSINGFVADVIRSDKTRSIAEGWQQHRVQELVAELRTLGPATMEYFLNEIQSEKV